MWRLCYNRRVLIDETSSPRLLCQECYCCLGFVLAKSLKKEKEKSCSSKACCCIRLSFSVLSDLPIFLFSTFSRLEPYPKPFSRLCSVVCVHICSVHCFTVNAGVLGTLGCSQHCSTEHHLIPEGSIRSLSPCSYRLLVQPLWE